MANLSSANGTIEFPSTMKDHIDEIRAWIKSFAPPDLTEEQKKDQSHYKYLWDYGFNYFAEDPESLAFPDDGPLLVHFEGTGKWSFEKCMEKGIGTITETVQEDMALARAIAITNSQVDIEFYDEEGGCGICKRNIGSWTATIDATGTPHAEWNFSYSEDLEPTTTTMIAYFGYDYYSAEKPEDMERIYSAYISGRKMQAGRKDKKLTQEQLKQVIMKSEDMDGKVLVMDMDDPERLLERLRQDPVYKAFALKQEKSKKSR